MATASAPHGRARTWLVLAVTVAAVLVAAFFLRPRGTPIQTGSGVGSTAPGGPKTGQAAPDFSAKTLDGSNVTLSGLRGKPVWIVFGASWCAGCRAEAPDVQAASVKAQADGVAVLAVYVDEDATAVQKYTDRLGLTMTNIPDPNSTVADLYAARGVPAHFFIDANGIIRQQIIGLVTPDTAASGIAAAQHPAP